MRVLRQDNLPKYMNFLASKLAESGGKFFGGEKPMMSDLAVLALLMGMTSGMWDHVPVTVADPWPTLKAHHDAMKAHPLVVEHGMLSK